MRADRAKQFRMRKSHSQRSVSAHRKAGDPARGPLGPNPISAFDERNELTQEEITIRSLTLTRIDIKRIPAVRRHNQEFAHHVLAAQILQAGPLSVQSD